VSIIITSSRSSSSGCASVIAVLSHGLCTDKETLLGRADAAAAASLVQQALWKHGLLLLMVLQRLLRMQWMEL
jgi:hypothetical protein